MVVVPTLFNFGENVTATSIIGGAGSDSVTFNLDSATAAGNNTGGGAGSLTPTSSDLVVV